MFDTNDPSTAPEVMPPLAPETAAEFDTENPASSLDVARAVTNLILATTLAIQDIESPMVDHEPHLHLIDGVSAAEEDLAVALETWLGEAQTFANATLVQGLAEPLMTRLKATHDEMHREGPAQVRGEQSVP